MPVSIREYATQAKAISAIQAGQEPAVANQNIASHAASTASAAFNANTRFIAVSTDTIIAILFAKGAAPTVLITDFRMAADTTMFFGVEPGDFLSVITRT